MSALFTGNAQPHDGAITFRQVEMIYSVASGWQVLDDPGTFVGLGEHRGTALQVCDYVDGHWTDWRNIFFVERPTL